MAITDKKRSAPKWRCGDCEEIFDGRAALAGVTNIDDVHDVFSKHRGQPLNVCPKCGGALQLLKSRSR